MTLGGDGQRSTWMHDTERRKKQSRLFSGQGNPFYGKTHSEENGEEDDLENFIVGGGFEEALRDHMFDHSKESDFALGVGGTRLGGGGG